jgi:hypothetical protein
MNKPCSFKVQSSTTSRPNPSFFLRQGQIYLAKACTFPFAGFVSCSWEKERAQDLAKRKHAFFCTFFSVKWLSAGRQAQAPSLAILPTAGHRSATAAYYLSERRLLPPLLFLMASVVCIVAHD